MAEKMARSMNQPFDNQTKNAENSTRNERKPSSAEKSKKVGEYIDFEEID